MEDEQLNPLEENCIYDKSANAVVDEVSSEECEHLQAFTGLDGAQKDNCPDLARLICDIKQEVDRININEPITIYANEASKCADDDLPTLASVFSRILRYAQAATCVLCAYDPRVAAVLKQGRYPQILMGGMQAGGYPQWVDPDTEPTVDSIHPVTSAGIYQAVREAVLAVWHLWEEHPAFDYFAQTLDDEADYHNLVSQTKDITLTDGLTALVASGTQGTSLLYTAKGGEWVFTRVLDKATDNLVNFATTHINNGYYTENGVYYFDGTWQVMDADLGEIDRRVDRLEVIYNTAVTTKPDANPIMLMTAATLEEAKSQPCDPDRDTVILITG